jgi:hypothetical protein
VLINNTVAMDNLQLYYVQQAETNPVQALNHIEQSGSNSASALDDSRPQKTVEACDFESALPDDTFATYPEACKHVLSRVTSKIPLRILESSIPDAGNGLFVTKDVPAGEDMFTSQPLVNLVETNSKETCDYCLMRPYGILHPDGYFRDLKPATGKLSMCNRCRTCCYYSGEIGPP